MSKIDQVVIDEIRSREAEALALGWTKELLYGEKRWNIVNLQNRTGLAAIMQSYYEIGDITPDYIETYRFRHGTKIVQKFLHPDRLHLIAGI